VSGVKKTNFDITFRARIPRPQFWANCTDRRREPLGSGQIETVGRLQVRRDR
jgi:hypothetical protein